MIEKWLWRLGLIGEEKENWYNIKRSLTGEEGGDGWDIVKTVMFEESIKKGW